MYFADNIYIPLLKVRISKIFASLSFAASMAISGNCRCVFGSSVSGFIISCHQLFLCLFGHSNSLLVMLAETGKKQLAASHTGEWESESAALKALLKAELCATCDFSGKVAADTRVIILQIQGLSSVDRRLSHHCVALFGDR